jgi:hypothetical protein
MRAKTINEIISFERGQNPKKSLGIGGVDLQNESMIREIKMKEEIEIIKEQYKKEWNEFLRNLLVGKRISGEMRKWRQNPNYEEYDFKNTTITVENLTREEEVETSLIEVTDGEYEYGIPLNGRKIFVE